MKWGTSKYFNVNQDRHDKNDPPKIILWMARFMVGLLILLFIFGLWFI